MLFQHGLYLFISFQNIMDAPFGSPVLKPDRSSGDDSFNFEMVGIAQKADQRLGIIGFVLNVGEHNHPGLYRFLPKDQLEGKKE
jgi:hypothetical protein